MKFNWLRLTLASLISLVVIGTSLAFFVSQAKAQDEIVLDITTRLVEQGVPVKDGKTTSRIPFKVEITIQSSSSNDRVMPDDPTFEHAVQREVTLAQGRHNIKLESVKVIIVNASGTPIYWSEVPLLEAPNILPSQLDEATTAQLVRDQLPLYGMALDAVDISSDANSARNLTIRLSVQDIQTANSALPHFMPELGVLLEKFNAEQGAQIVICKVDIVDAKGQPLLKYVRDFQLSQENWWQAEGLTQDWFEHPG